MISLIDHDSRARENSEVVIIYPDLCIYIFNNRDHHARLRLVRTFRISSEPPFFYHGMTWAVLKWEHRPLAGMVHWYSNWLGTTGFNFGYLYIPMGPIPNKIFSKSLGMATAWKIASFDSYINYQPGGHHRVEKMMNKLGARFPLQIWANHHMYLYVISLKLAAI